MLAKRIVPCLDVKDGQVIKGVQFRGHEVVGGIVELAQRYSDEGADELVFYDITASSDRRTVGVDWVEKVARAINIPFCVAGGISSVADARAVLNAGADKISINTPALNNPQLIQDMAQAFGKQCVVVGVDSKEENGDYFVYQYTGDPDAMQQAKKRTADWLKEAQELGAGEVVLNCMNQDGVRAGYDIKQLKMAREILQIPLIASGGAGAVEHFETVFDEANVDGALAASVFHKGVFRVDELKQYLIENGVNVRPC